jgi:hypothetical protein
VLSRSLKVRLAAAKSKAALHGVPAPQESFAEIARATDEHRCYCPHTRGQERMGIIGRDL